MSTTTTAPSTAEKQLAEHNGINRAECIRRLIDVALGELDAAAFSTEG